MFRIGFDAVVEEYAARMISLMFYAKNSTFELTGELSDKHKEEIYVNTLISMVHSGSAQYRYRSSDNVDEFRSTDRLIQNWCWLFNGAVLKAKRSEHKILEVSGRRSRFFEEGWQIPDRDNPAPAWPS